MYYASEDLTYIVNDEKSQFIPVGDSQEFKEFEQWAIENNTSLEQLPTWPPVTEEMILQRYNDALQTHFDAVAKQKDYDNTMSIVSYYASTNVQWAQESQTFIAWRDACWSVAFQVLDEVQTGQRVAPTVEQFLSELPIINWP